MAFVAESAAASISTCLPLLHEASVSCRTRVGSKAAVTAALSKSIKSRNPRFVPASYANSYGSTLEESQWRYNNDNGSSTSEGEAPAEIERGPVPDMVEKSELNALRTRLNLRLSSANTYNRYLLRELQYREDTLKETKSELLAVMSEVKELSLMADEIANMAGWPATRKVEGKYLPSHIALRLEELSIVLQQQLAGIESMRLKEVPLTWFGMAEDVKIMGSFDGWTYGEQMSPETTGTMTKFHTVLKLRPGRYEVKFLVDGEWRVAPEWPSVGHGMTENNIIVVE